MAGVAGLEPVTSAVTGQRSNQLSYTPVKGERESTQCPPTCQRALPIFSKKTFGQQTPRRWGWGTPLKKRTATRTNPSSLPATVEPASSLSIILTGREFYLIAPIPQPEFNDYLHLSTCLRARFKI